MPNDNELDERVANLERVAQQAKEDHLPHEDQDGLMRIERKISEGFMRLHERYDRRSVRLDATDLMVDIRLTRLSAQFDKLAAGQEQITQLLTRIIEEKQA